jgi:asparagine synthase (glutamine-hydrolysing)
MCGIIGVVAASQSLNGLQAFDQALGSIRHRGPDASRRLVYPFPDYSVVLGHARLSILDLSPAGLQPMQSHGGELAVVFNGEIYNYLELKDQISSAVKSWQSGSDTEVLLEAWNRLGGSAVLPRLQGMFSFGMLDRRRRQLWLVRDPFGIKPLFYTPQPLQGVLAFASEMQALLPLFPDEIGLDLQQAYEYLVYGTYDQTEATFFQGVQQLQPGHYVVISLDDGSVSRPVRWWNPSIRERSDLNFNDAVDELRQRFLASVRLHLRSDVPVGAALSGGVDSSAVVCGMRHVEPDLPIHTFTYVARGSSVDEEQWADQVNQYVSAIPHKVEADFESLDRDLDELIAAQGEPFGSTSIYAQFRVFQAAKAAGIIVTLDGQGADELLAGYSGYPSARLRSLISERQPLEAMQFAAAWSAWPGRSKRMAVAMTLRALLSERQTQWLRQVYGLRQIPWLNHRWLQSHGIDFGLSIRDRFDLNYLPNGRSLVFALRESLMGSGLAPLLRHADRNSMHWSIESRVPFLTSDLAEFLLSLPEEYLVSSQGETKHVFRAAMRGIVPDAVLDRRDKIGFATPEAIWLTRLGPRIIEWLEPARDLPFIKYNLLIQSVNAALSGSRPVTMQTWRIINFCRWIALTNVRVP